ncbi:MAG: hypothetical protein K0V04_36560 [Deltaproteobacteria bacterium]|nr:hypothetical protein [Deltaproteobacteria bacterium]
MPASSTVFMVPGFLGFVGLGRFEYFRRVGEHLSAACRGYGESPKIVRVEIHPSASLRERATQLALAIHAHANADDGPVHLVAHSTGGLDARLLLTPGVSLPVDFDLETVVGRVRSLVTVATPHHGTPLASFFDGLLAQRILRLGSQGAAQALRVTRIPLGLAERLVALLHRATAGRSKGPGGRALAEIRDDLLDAIPDDQRAPLQRLLERMADDQALVPQLAPEGLELFNTSTNDRPGVRYGCVLARAPRPGLRTVVRAGARPTAQTSSALYSALHQIAARTPTNRSRSFDRGRWQEVAAAYGDAVDWADSDGVVPTLSQVWGQLVHAASADHLDVVGHFADDSRPAEHRDVLVSGSRFGRGEFGRVWHDVAGFLCRATVDRPVECSQITGPRGPGALALPSAGRPAMTDDGRQLPVAIVPAAPTRVDSPGRPLALRWRPFAADLAIGVTGLTGAFFGYELWRGAVGEHGIARWIGFVACVAVVWVVVRRARS